MAGAEKLAAHRVRRRLLRLYHSLIARQCALIGIFAALSIAALARLPDEAAIVISVAFAAMAILLSLGIRQSTRDVRASMRRTTAGGDPARSVVECNPVPEFDGIVREFDDAIAAMRQSERSVREAAETSAHALKAPVATIQSALDIISGNVSDDAPNVRRAIELMRSAVAKMRILISAAHRPNNGLPHGLEGRRAPIDLSEQLAELVQDYRVVLRERSVDFAFFADRDVVILGMRSVVQVAIENVIENAISFSPPGTVITVRLRKETGAAHLVIEDEGPGVADEWIERLFDRHVSRRDCEYPAKSWTAGMPHAGLGLWITRHNIEALGGNVFASNREPRGLSLHMILPIAEGVPPADGAPAVNGARTANEMH